MTFTLIISALSFITSCTPSANNGKRVLTVSIQPQKFLLEKIVGDKYEVNCLLNQNSNPEAYEPNMSHLSNLEKSDAYFQIGNIGFELAISKKIKSNYPDLKIFDTSKDIEYIYGSHCAQGSDHQHSDIDPHIWSSVNNAQQIASNMCSYLCEINPKDKDFFQKNLNNLNAELKTLNDSISSLLKPFEGCSFVVWHPSLSYFARDYKLNQVSLSNIGKEFSIKGLKNRIDKAKNDSALVFLFQPEFDSRQAETINNRLKARMVQINPMAYEWDKEMLKTAHAIAGK